MNVPIDNIIVAPDRNPIVEQTVISLMSSIKEVGLINAVTVNTDYRLIAGAHRLEACRRLGFSEIDAEVKDLDDLRAELAEIDENLVRNELHYIDIAEQTKRRKEVYEALHPESKAGVAGGKASGVSRGTTAPGATVQSFSDDTFTKTGVAPRTIRQSVQIAEGLTAESKQAAKEMGLRKKESIALARMSEEEQADAVQKRVAGEIKDVRELAKPMRNTPPTPGAARATFDEMISRELPPKVDTGVHGSEILEAHKNIERGTITAEQKADLATTIASRQAMRTTDSISVLVKLLKEQTDQYLANQRKLLANHSTTVLSGAEGENKVKAIAALDEAETAIRKMKELLK